MTRTITADGRTESVSAIISRLSTAQKSNRGAPGYSRWVNRPLGRLLAAMAYRAGLTPNQVTALSATLSFAAVALIAAVRPTVWVGLLLALMLVTAYALDSADGQLARLQGSGSPSGEWLDHVVDCIKSSAIHLAVLICWFRFYDLTHAALFLIPIVFCIESAVWFFAIILTERLHIETAGALSKSLATPRESAPFLRSVMMLPADYGTLCLSFALLGFHTSFLTVYGILAALNIFFLSVALPRWYLSLRLAQSNG